MVKDVVNVVRNVVYVVRNVVKNVVNVVKVLNFLLFSGCSSVQSHCQYDSLSSVDPPRIWTSTIIVIFGWISNHVSSYK